MTECVSKVKLFYDVLVFRRFLVGESHMLLLNSSINHRVASWWLVSFTYKHDLGGLMSIHPYEFLSQYGNDPRTRSMLAGRKWHGRSPFFPSFHAIGALTSTWNFPKTRYTIPSIPMLMSYIAYAPIFTKHTSIFHNFPHPKPPITMVYGIYNYS